MLNVANILEKVQKNVERQIALLREGFHCRQNGIIPEVEEVKKEIKKKIEGSTSEDVTEVRKNREWQEIDLSGIDNNFIAVYGTTSVDDILAAKNSGKFVFCKDDDTITPLSSVTTSNGLTTVVFCKVKDEYATDGLKNKVYTITAVKSGSNTTWERKSLNLNDCNIYYEEKVFDWDEVEVLYQIPEGYTPTSWQELVQFVKELPQKPIIVRHVYVENGVTSFKDMAFNNVDVDCLDRPYSDDMWMWFQYDDGRYKVIKDMYFADNEMEDHTYVYSFHSKAYYNKTWSGSDNYHFWPKEAWMAPNNGTLHKWYFAKIIESDGEQPDGTVNIYWYNHKSMEQETYNGSTFVMEPTYFVCKILPENTNNMLVRMFKSKFYARGQKSDSWSWSKRYIALAPVDTNN